MDSCASFYVCVFLQGAKVTWKDFLARLSLRNFLAKVHLRVEPHWVGERMVVQYTAPDSSTGTPTDIIARYPLPPYPGDCLAAAWVYHRLSEALVHEIGHALHLDDRCLYDPHKGLG